MTSVLVLLDEVPNSSETGSSADWFSHIEVSLQRNPNDWVAAIARIGHLSDEHAWSLLSWIEIAASRIVRTRSLAHLATAAFAMALVLQSSLDRRDCAVVASLLRRASVLADLDYQVGVADGSNQAGANGPSAAGLLLHASPDTPSTHVESGAGETFAFTRLTPTFDVADLQRWLEGDGP